MLRCCRDSGAVECFAVLEGKREEGRMVGQQQGDAHPTAALVQVPRAGRQPKARAAAAEDVQQRRAAAIPQASRLPEASRRPPGLDTALLARYALRLAASASAGCRLLPWCGPPWLRWCGAAR